jgi:hypothetical protein
LNVKPATQSKKTYRQQPPPQHPCSSRDIHRPASGVVERQLPFSNPQVATISLEPGGVAGNSADRIWYVRCGHNPYVAAAHGWRLSLMRITSEAAIRG